MLGIIRFGLEFGFSKPGCGSGLEDMRPSFVRHFVDDVHYLHYGALLFIITGVTAIIISLMTEPIPEEKMYRLTYWTRKSDQVRQGFDDDDDDDEEEDKYEKSKDDVRELSGCKKIIYLLCGISQKSTNQTYKVQKKSREEEVAEAAAFLTEKKSLKIIINIFSVLSLSAAVFMMAFYT